MNYWLVPLGGVLMFVIYLVILAIIAWALYAIIRVAVRTALDDHFRKQEWYKVTGLWYSGKPPKGIPGASTLSKAERKDLPPDERPERG